MVQIKISEVEKPPLLSDPNKLTSVSSTTPRDPADLRAKQAAKRNER